MNRKRRTRRAFSLVEVLLSSTLTVTVLMVAVGTFLTGMVGWARGQGRIDAEEGAQQGVRIVSQTVREAMSVTVDANGQGLTYQMPATDGTGNYTVPVVWDGITRRLFLSNGNLMVSANESSRILCKGVITTDPLTTNGTGTYRIFTPGGGAVTRSISVMVVSQRSADGNKMATSRSRETIYLRNIPDLFR
jgi:hypothetical protein